MPADSAATAVGIGSFEASDTAGIAALPAAAVDSAVAPVDLVVAVANLVIAGAAKVYTKGMQFPPDGFGG